MSQAIQFSFTKGLPKQAKSKAPPSATGHSETPQAHQGLDPWSLPAGSDPGTLIPAPPPVSHLLCSEHCDLIDLVHQKQHDMSRHPGYLQGWLPGAKQDRQALAQTVPALPHPGRARVAIPVATAQRRDNFNSVI